MGSQDPRKMPQTETQILILSLMADGREWRIPDLLYEIRRQGIEKSYVAVRDALKKLLRKQIVKRTRTGRYIVDGERAETYIKFYKYFVIKGR